MKMTSEADRRVSLTSLAIHTDKTSQGERLKYYSNLSIETSPKFRWKVYLGDLVAISTTDDAPNSQNETGLDRLDGWSSGHYEEPSPHWKVGLVVALCNRVTTAAQGLFECHVQWLDKCMDCPGGEIASLRATFRSHGAQSGRKGGQLPHILINRPGEYGAVSPLRLLPVKIHMMDKAEFNARGVLAQDESQFFLKFCCLKARRTVAVQEASDPAATGGSIRAVKSVIVAEAAPDEWTKLNAPTSGDDDRVDASLPLPVPEPLRQAWKGWLGSVSTVSSLSSSSDELENALTMGWTRSRRERSRKIARSEAIAEQAKNDFDANGASRAAGGTESMAGYEKGGKSNKALRQPSSIMRDTTHCRLNHKVDAKLSKKRKADTKDGSNVASASSATKRRKELRFSAGTKQAVPAMTTLASGAAQPAKTGVGRSGSASNSADTSGQNKKKRAGASGSSGENADTAKSTASKKQNAEKPKHQFDFAANQLAAPTARGETASTATLETRSTDTTLPARGTSRKRRGKPSTTSVVSSSHDGNLHDETSARSICSSTISSIACSELSSALEEWRIEPTHDDPIHKTNVREYYAGLRMSIPANCSVGSLLEESPESAPDRCDGLGSHQQKDLHFAVGIGSVVAVHCENAEAGNDSWSPFRVPWGVAQIVSIYRTSDVKSSSVDENDDDGHADGDSWSLKIKWFYRYSELSKSRQNMVANTIDERYGLVETSEVASSCSAKSVLPGHILLTSDSACFQTPNKSESGDDGLPIVRMLCQHLQSTKITALSDWSFSYSPLAANLGEVVSSSMQRVLAKMGSTIKSKYLTWLSEVQFSRKGPAGFSASAYDDASHTSDEALCEICGIKFYDSLILNVDERSLMPPFRGKSKTFNVAVGHVVAVAVKQAPLATVGTRKSDCWFPFTKSWTPAQVVSLYRTQSNQLMTQIRWFDRFHEIQKHHRANLKGLDSPFVMFETEVFEQVPLAAILPGRIVPTSMETLHDWDAKASEHSGLPLIPRLCTYICLDDEIDISRDWTDYDINLPKIPNPLSRGLQLSPRNRQNKEWILTLTRFYGKAISSRDIDPDYRALERWSTSSEKVSSSMESTLFKENDVTVSTGSHLSATELHSHNRAFYKFLFVSSPVKYIVAPSNVMKRTKTNSFKCRLGDIVTFFDPTALSPEKGVSVQLIKHPWFPFNVPWSYGQVLSIYKESTSGEMDTCLVEIRRFFRASEISEVSKLFLPPDEATVEEVFESDQVSDGIPASHVLGLARIFLGHHESSGDEETSINVTYMASCRCRFFYLGSHQKLQPIHSSSLLPAGWLTRMEERGYHQSKYFRQHPSLIATLGIENRPSTNSGNFKDLLSPTKQIAIEGSCANLGAPILSLPASRSFFAEISLHPQWSMFVGSDILYRFKQGESKPWRVKVGDFIAVKAINSTGDDGTYPFRVPWAPCQLLAIYETTTASSGHTLLFTIRLLMAKTPANEESVFTEVTECSPQETRTVVTTDLLGPLVLHLDGLHSKLDLVAIQPHLPLCQLHAAKSLNIHLEDVLSLANIYSTDEIRQLKQLLKPTKMAHRKRVGRPHSSLPPPAEFRDKNLYNQPGDMWAESAPFRVDWSAFRAFYSEVCLNPKNRTSPSDVSDEALQQMTLRTGDVILVRLEGPKRIPMDCHWGVAEVLAIFKSLSSREALDQFLKPETNSHDNKYDIEIRWFYERQDISMASNLCHLEDPGELVEVFETDHVQTMDAGTSVLAHAKLVESDTIDVENSDPKKLSFVCKRFWSTQRRSLIPCSGLDGRERRSMMYSKCLPPDLRGISSSHRNSQHQSVQSIPGWKESMANVIGKLTLKNASRNAYEEGADLVGREAELEKLISFVESALRGDPGKGGVKSSMFLAGPPGVGKTACVRAAISRLQHQQSKGQLPRFRFIGLNGMELRHPFEAYVRFWEALTGRKHIGSYEKACEWLGTYFTSPSATLGQDDDAATVVLLDEIDYLVTDKQTVLYDFFNWPKQAAGTASGKRLIVLGISNTLNLADQLMPSVRSRMDSEKCVFKAYSLQDTISILNSKLTEASPHFRFFEDDALLFAAKKTAALSGDIRRAFQLCRAAAEVVTQRFESDQTNLQGQVIQPYPKIRIGDVQKVSQESFNMALIAAVSFSASFEALLLISLAALRRSTGREVGGFDVQDILVKMEAIASASGNPQYCPPPAFGETLHLINRLGEMNLLEVHTGRSSVQSLRDIRGGGFGMTSLSVDEHTLLRGFKNTPHKQLSQSILPSLF